MSRCLLQHKDIGDIMLIVIRYFGGIKLGAGGLVRAYSAATQQAITALKLKEQRFLTQAFVSGDFSFEQSLRHWLSVHGGSVSSVEYGENVSLTIALEEEHLKALGAFALGYGAELKIPS